MDSLVHKNILIVIPKNQFCEEELHGTLDPLKASGARVIVLSPNGQEARGMNKTRFQPDGILVDWDKQPGISGKYDAVLVLGGKGSPKSLWDHPILPQILTDHHRAGKPVGAIGASVVVLARAGLIQNAISAPDDEKVATALEENGITPLSTSISLNNHVLAAKDASVIKEFIETIGKELKN